MSALDKPKETLVDIRPTFTIAEVSKGGLWDTVLDQLDDVAQRIDLDPGIHAILRQPERELTVSVPSQNGRWPDQGPYRLPRPAF